jgi:hypothetical protein
MQEEPLLACTGTTVRGAYMKEVGRLIMSAQQAQREEIPEADSEQIEVWCERKGNKPP